MGIRNKTKRKICTIEDCTYCPYYKKEYMHGKWYTSWYYLHYCRLTDYYAHTTYQLFKLCKLPDYDGDQE